MLKVFRVHSAAAAAADELKKGAAAEFPISEFVKETNRSEKLKITLKILQRTVCTMCNTFSKKGRLVK